MSGPDPEAFLKWKAGFDELGRFELEERRAATPLMRMRQLDAIWLLSRELRIPVKEHSFDPIVNAQWAKLRKAIHERDREGSQ